MDRYHNMCSPPRKEDGMKAIVFPSTLDELVVSQQWPAQIMRIVENAKGKKAAQLTSEEKAAIGLLSGMTPTVVDDHIIGSVRVGPADAFEVIDGKDGKWCVVSCAPLRNR